MTADPQPTPKAPARTWQEQVANIQRNLAAKTMSCDRDTHRNDNPQWIEEEKQMNLGPRCNFMLPNHCQCPNTALADSDMCELHKEFQTEQAVAVEQAKIEKLEK